VVTARDAVANRKEIPMKLTDTQLVLLSAASQREDGDLELAPNLKGGAARKVVGKLLTEGLVEEIPARGSLVPGLLATRGSHPPRRLLRRGIGSLPVWRRDDEEGARRCASPSAGLRAIHVDEGGDARGSGTPPLRARARSRSSRGAQKNRHRNCPECEFAS
jgi:hypothetical protein